jgi:hypothetical protein
MLSNLSDLLMSRVSPDPVQPTATLRTSMVGMSPQSQAQVAQQQAPVQQPAQYLQAATNGKPSKTPKAVLDWLNSMETEGVYTPPGEIPAHLQSTAQSGQPVKQFNAMTANMSAGNPTGEEPTNKYQALLKGDYTALGAGKGAKSSVEAFLNESDDMKYKRFLMSHNFTGEALDKKLWEKEQVNAFRDDLSKKGLSRNQIDKKAVEFLKNLKVD